MSRNEHELQAALTEASPEWAVTRARPGVFGRVEDAVGSFFTAFIDCGVIGSLGLVAVDAFMGTGSFRPDPLLMALAAMLALVINGRHLVWLWIGWSDRQRPTAIATALQQRVGLVILRPLISAWWLGCVLPPIFMSLSSHQIEPRDGEYLVRAIHAVLVFGLLYAANGFLLLAASVWTHNERFLQWIWRFRIWVDLAVTALGLGLGSLIFGK